MGKRGPPLANAIFYIIFSGPTLEKIVIWDRSHPPLGNRSHEYERHDLGHGVFFHQIFELIN